MGIALKSIPRIAAIASLGAIAVVAILGVVGLLVVWTLNTLFGLGLPYTIATVTAGALLAGLLGNNHVRSK